MKNTATSKGLLAFLLILILGSVPKQANSAPIVIGVDPFSPTIQAFDAAGPFVPAGPPVPITMAGFTVTGATSVTWNSDDLFFYAIIKTDVPVGPDERHLAIVDPLTGICSHIGLLSSTSFSSLTYNSDLGIMYAMGGSGGGPGVAECLFRVDLTTAATNFLAGPFSVGTFGEVIAYNYSDDMIYHWSGDAPTAMMEKIDPVTFVATPVPASGMPHSEIQGAVYVGGGIFVATDLFFSTGATMSFTITSGGFASLLGPTPYQVRGLAFVDPVLPVELASFVSSVSGRNVELNWTTAAESNNSGFDIERRDARGETQDVWMKIGAVSGNGTTTSPQSYSFTDRNLTSGNYSYRLKQIDFNGNFEYFNLSNEVNVGIPANYDLSQNYPNPFNPTTNLEFGISELGLVSLKVYNASGEEVATLVNEIKTAGYYTVNFNASGLSSGVYFYTLSSNNFTTTKKMMLLK